MEKPRRQETGRETKHPTRTKGTTWGIKQQRLTRDTWEGAELETRDLTRGRRQEEHMTKTNRSTWNRVTDST